ncbi:MAG TPA: fumarylacetoacetate hydrolase family protein [Acidimicrobiales bacterium]|nr:fumarylacetoacetate hydrolase family protein [Acidimicrobiales bacterium]
MTLSAEEVAGAADALFDAGRSRRPIAPLTDRHPTIDVSDAYAVQLANVDRLRKEGQQVAGHKVGLSSRAMQRMLGVDEPDYGHLLDPMFLLDGESVPITRFIQPRVEIEVAFVLGRALAGPGRTVADVVRATDCVLPAIEIVDSRVVDWSIRLPDTIADNASSGAVVLGGRPRRVTDLDLKVTGGLLRANGRITETGAAGAVLGNPMTAVAWLANKVAAFGVTLDPGHVIMSGSFTRMIPVRAGDDVRAELEDMGNVAISFR